MSEENSCEKCVSAGVSLFREADAYRADRSTPIIYNINLRGLVRTDDMKVPHSELAMHTGAAGKEILALVTTGSVASAVYRDEKEGCGFIHGLDSEVLSIGLRNQVEEMWGPKSKIRSPLEAKLSEEKVIDLPLGRKGIRG